MTPTDLQTLLDYFDLIAYQRFMNYFQNHATVAAVPETPEFVPTTTF
jgi:hypothetical protein